MRKGCDTGRLTETSKMLEDGAHKQLTTSRSSAVKYCAHFASDPYKRQPSTFYTLGYEWRMNGRLSSLALQSARDR